MSSHSAQKIHSYPIENDFLYMEVLNYGARIRKLYLKSKPNIPLVVGLENTSDYLKDIWSLGACLGPYAGRLEKNGKIELHGGEAAFSKQFWSVEQKSSKNNAITLKYLYRDIKNNLVSVYLRYQLEGSSLLLSYKAIPQVECLLNLSNHTYFTLDCQQQIDHYQLQIHSEQYLKLDQNLLPTGEICNGLPPDIDFSFKKSIGKQRLDHIYLTQNCTNSSELTKVASVSSQQSNIQMDVYTDQEVLVCFTPNTFAGICFETQGFPNAPAHPHFSQAYVGPNQEYQQQSRFSFSHF